MKLRGFALAVALLGMVGCATYVHPTPTQSAYVLPGKTEGGANIVIADTELAKTASAHFGIAGFLFPVKVSCGEVVPKYLKECLRRVFSNVSVNGDGKYDAIFDVKITEMDLSALTGKATVDLFVDGKFVDGQPLVHGEYTGTGSGHFPLYVTMYGEAFYDQQQEQMRTTIHQALTQLCNQLIADVEDKVAAIPPKPVRP